jgi:putative tryptophan/tyrosine transport system substrate-binding protein
MKRREFMTLLGGAAAGWPLAARAQQGERMRRIGVLAGGAIESAADTQERNAAFAQTLQQLGWTNGNNVRIDYRYGLGNAANVRKYAAELVSLAPDVILASGASVLAPLLQATRTLPIVFVAVVDPVGAGFVESMAQPGGNAKLVINLKTAKALGSTSSWQREHWRRLLPSAPLLRSRLS